MIRALLPMSTAGLCKKKGEESKRKLYSLFCFQFCLSEGLLTLQFYLHCMNTKPKKH